MFQLRDYQAKCLSIIQEEKNLGIAKQLISLPTGSGKTVIFASWIKSNPSEKFLIIAHTDELLDQAQEKLNMICPGVTSTVINRNNKVLRGRVIIGSIQTVSKKHLLEELLAYGISTVIIDEAHHVRAISYEKVVVSMQPKLLLGFTATPYRGDGKGLSDIFEKMVFSKTLQDMIKEGYLCRLIGTKVHLEIDIKSVGLIGADGKEITTSQLVNTSEYNEKIVRAYLDTAPNCKAICFGASILHAEALATEFRKQGVNAVSVDSTDSPEARQDVIRHYRNGDIQVLCNCRILTEGFDDPSTRCIIIANPTNNRGMYAQMVGRGTRLAANKSYCHVIDVTTLNLDMCTCEELTVDVEKIEAISSEEQEKSASREPTIPGGLNAKLTLILKEVALSKNMFNWVKNTEYTIQDEILNGFLLKGAEVILIIFEDPRSKTWVAQVATNSVRGSQEWQCLGSGLSQEFAFTTAEDYANRNRQKFVLQDKGAFWRGKPISKKQLKALQSFGYRKAIDKLTKGQASDLLEMLLPKKTP